MALIEEMVTSGVMENWEYPATAEPAGLNTMDPRSPPTAVIALPMPTERAVPEYWFWEYR